jgi:hypothetical protein
MLWLLACGDPDTDVADDTDCTPQDWYPDADGDTHGSMMYLPRSACTAPAGFVAVADDCDDADATIHPGVSESPGDGVDQNCDGVDGTQPAWPDWPTLAPCPAYSGVLGPTTTNSIATTPGEVGACSSSREWVTTATITAMSGDDTERTFEVDTVGDRGTTCYFEIHGEDRAQYRCDADGLWLLSRSGDFVNGEHLGGAPADRIYQEITFDVTYDGDGLLVLPADPDATTSWVDDVSATATITSSWRDGTMSEPTVDTSTATYTNEYTFTSTTSLEELAMADIARYTDPYVPGADEILVVSGVRTGDGWPGRPDPLWATDGYRFTAQSYFDGHLGWLHPTVGPTSPPENTYSSTHIWQTVVP